MHLHVIGIGGIGISALARYYLDLGYTISGSDSHDSTLIHTLRSEGMSISIGHQDYHLPDTTDLVIYSEAIITQPDLPPEEQIYANRELAHARNLGIPHFSYPVALAQVFDTHRGIAIAGSHGKSTTTAMTATMLLGSEIDFSVIVGTQVPQLGGMNFYRQDSGEMSREKHFIIEACEYKRSFLQYHPYITVITNIDLDHLDYYRDLEDYLSAFQSLVDQTSGYVIISADDPHSSRLIIPEQKKVVVGNGKILYHRFVEHLAPQGGTIHTEYELSSLILPTLHLRVPGDHLLHDAHLAYTVGRLLQMEQEVLTDGLQRYQGSWRRSEVIGTTKHGNILMSDYGHHPSEILPTIQAIRAKYSDKKLFVVFQPHQYSRTKELLDQFAGCFGDLDSLVIPDIYFSRDSHEDVEWMTLSRLIETIRPHQPTVMDGGGLEHTADIIRAYDHDHPDSSVILLLGAGDVDTLRDEIEMMG